MANTVVRDGLNIDVIFDGATALDFATDTTIDLPGGAHYTRLIFVPAAVNDTLTLRATDATGARVFYFKSVDGGPQKADLDSEFYRFYVVGNQATAGCAVLLRITK